MTKVKICGIRREADVLSVNRHLPEYIGYVFAESRRRITPEHAAELSGLLDRRIKKVGVFVNEEIEKIAEIVNKCSLDAVQLHGDESSDMIDELGARLDRMEKARPELWKAVRVKDAHSLKLVKGFDVDKLVLDTYDEASYGGAGRVFDWSLALEAGKCRDIVLAGGLKADNLVEAIRVLAPAVVDVSSGVETDGWKDERKIRDFIYTARYNTY